MIFDLAQVARAKFSLPLMQTMNAELILIATLIRSFDLHAGAIQINSRQWIRS